MKALSQIVAAIGFGVVGMVFGMLGATIGMSIAESEAAMPFVFSFTIGCAIVGAVIGWNRVK
jgi:hypothetical protein